jgi:hypothetical protein
MVFIMMAAVGAIGAFYGYRYGGKTGAAAGFAAGAAVSFLAGILIRQLTGSVGGSAGNVLYGGRTPNWSLRERLGADLSQAAHHKKNERYDQALRKVNEILDQEPRFPEAMLLKAQIMWDGYENASAARRYLKEVMGQTPRSGSLHKEAFSLDRELARIEKIKRAQATAEGKSQG